MMRATANAAAGSEERVQLARDYAELLSAGETAQAAALLDRINVLSGQEQCVQGVGIYEQVGRLTREMHESMNEFVHDTRMAAMMHEEMPDARQRLNHVIETTEQSAHTTIGAVEESAPILAVLKQRASELRVLVEERLVDEGRVSGMQFVREELVAFLRLVYSDTSRVNEELNRIMMVQGYQDLTGQVIQRVITLVQEVEDSLVSILKLGHGSTREAAARVTSRAADRSGHGPAVPGVEHGDVMNSQDDVDDLLSSLGF